ncbi:MAG TPA: hypothetical protein ENN29_09170, partial [Candidatus Hydrogenedentes bacterium]|nr:hypothetical protein [Candidatus Hydrogenedentota bacterium]
ANTEQLLDCLQTMVDDQKISGYHQLRHRQTENVIWIEMHILMPTDMPTGVAHEQITKVEEAVRRLFPERDIHITTHVEPAEHQAAHPEGHEGLPDPYPSGNSAEEPQ